MQTAIILLLYVHCCIITNIFAMIKGTMALSPSERMWVKMFGSLQEICHRC